MKGISRSVGTAAEKKAISNILKHYNPLIGALNEMGKQFTEDGSPSLFSKDSNTKNKAMGGVHYIHYA